MQERNEIIEELKHLVHYYGQATHEFFDDAAEELQKHLETFYGCLEKDQNSLEEYHEMVELLVSFQKDLKQRVEDLIYLTDRMNHLFKSPS